jgi:hypothetical protein
VLYKHRLIATPARRSGIAEPGRTQFRFLRVITLDDGETVHNAFFDRDFREEEP